MLPGELNNELPKSLLRYVWSIKVLKAGLGVESEQQVRDYFYQNPQVLREFEAMNAELLAGIKVLQMRAIEGLRWETRDKMMVNFKPNNKRVRMDEFMKSGRDAEFDELS